MIEFEDNLNKRVLNHVARIELDLEMDEPIIVSFHYQYKDYLSMNELVDVSIIIKISIMNCSLKELAR